jgi:hypothetical protein
VWRQVQIDEGRPARVRGGLRAGGRGAREQAERQGGAADYSSLAMANQIVSGAPSETRTV